LGSKVLVQTSSPIWRQNWRYWD